VKVITLSPESFQKSAFKLAEKVYEKEESIDMIIGIATGGAYVSRHVRTCFTQHGWQGSYREVRLSRTSTDTKEKLGLDSLLSHLPYPVLDLLRNAEAYYHRLKRDPTPPESSTVPVELPQEVTAEIQQAEHILLIDDAVDTGATLLRLRNTFAYLNPDVTITTAVLTVTQDDPYLFPDHTLYEDTLLRCPWAMDYKASHA